MDESELEMAERLFLSQIEEGIERAKRALPTQPAGFDGRCTECGEPIPARRLSFGACTCVDCQEHLERSLSSRTRTMESF
jgi:RNA polymerase-binding transcription factor DksA